MSTVQSRTAKSKQTAQIDPETAALMEPREQAGNTKPDSQAGTKDPRRHSINTKLTERASSSEPSTHGRFHRYEEHTGRTESLTYQSISQQLTSHSANVNNLKLADFVDVQQLMNIGYRNPELLPIVKRVSIVGEIMGKFNYQVQSELVALVKVVEKTVKEFVYMKNTAYNSDAIVDTVYRLLPKLIKSFSHIVLKEGTFILDPALRNIAEWKKISEKLSRKKTQKQPMVHLFDLSKRFQMRDLIKIGHDHPEFRANIKTILGVRAAMKHLNHDGQVEIYNILRCIEKIIKDLVQEKTNPGGSHDIFLTPEVLSSNLDYCIEKILKILKSPPKAPLECLQCDLDRIYVRNFQIKPVLGTLKQRRVKDISIHQQQTIFECANWGVSQDGIQNLESLIHHLAAKKGAYEHAWLFENCVDWFEIASSFAAYKSATRRDMGRMQTLKLQILTNLGQMETVMDSARDFCYRMANVPFTESDTLSDVIALSGQVEMLASEVDDYFKMFDRIIKELLRSKKEYTTLSTTIRANRLLFLTKAQWNAFDFPFY